MIIKLSTIIKQKEKINKKGINENKNFQIETPKKY
jgi:hypothetical protein